MSKTIEEQISAFSDGELPDEELELLLHRLERVKEHRSTLATYALIGELIRGEAVDHRVSKLSSSVMDVVTETGAVQSVGARWKLKKMVVRLMPSVVGGAIAASVAVLALLSLGALQTGYDPTTFDRPVLSSVADSGNQARDYEKISYTVPEATFRKAAIAPARLTSYLVSHGEYARTFPWTVMDSRIVAQQPQVDE